MSDRRNKRRLAKKEQHKHVSIFPEQFVAIPREEFPALERPPVSAWKNRNYLVLLYVENNPQFPGLMRLSICRTETNGYSWKDGLTWDELQSIKHEVGFGSSYAIEVYPADRDVVNVANFRHLWLLAKPLEIGWFNDSKNGEKLPDPYYTHLRRETRQVPEEPPTPFDSSSR